jgi:hypothetical protein
MNGGSVGMLAERMDYVIGVDTHRDQHTLAVGDLVGFTIASSSAVDLCRALA